MNKYYDAVIVGASIAGLYTGWKLAESGFHICIIDRREKIGLPIRCGEATGNRKELERFVPIDESWVATDLMGLAVHFNDTFNMTRTIPNTGIILHRDKFEQKLAYYAKNAGVDIILKMPVVGIIKDRNGLSLDNGEQVYARWIIGADGCESFIGRCAGITNALPLRDSFPSLQYTITSEYLNDRYLHFFIGSKVIKQGYLWVFPRGDKCTSLGAGLYRSNSGKELLKDTVDRFIKEHIPDAKPREFITGCIPLSISPKSFVKGNVLVVGDAARQVNPLTAGGIMNTLEASDCAVKALIAHWYDPQKVDCDYSGKWRRTVRRDQKVFYLFKEVLIDLSDSEIIDALKKTALIFKNKNINRNKIFAFSLISLLQLTVTFFPKFIRKLWKLKKMLLS